jgi:hypothetical protein
VTPDQTHRIKNIRETIGQAPDVAFLLGIIDEQEATLSKLPTTADGAKIVLGIDYVWAHLDDEHGIVKWKTETDPVIGSSGRCYPLISDEATGDSDWEYITDEDGNCVTRQVAMCYSSRPAALAAAGNETVATRKTLSSTTGRDNPSRHRVSQSA